MPEKYCFVVALCILLPCYSFSQGNLVLVGGGSESKGGWSDKPYSWAVERSSNKKVAIISYGDGDSFIPDYFNALGAAGADNIKIDSRAMADLQSTYDSLMRYDVFFFKGGDQSLYYKNYRNTKTSQAIVDKFQEGGVIAGTSAGMAILSGVIFTGENGSVYPDEALKDFKNSKMSLAGDFLPILPGYIFDSHFTERGRVGRLIPFMVNWFVNTGELIKGIGVDDRTALCIEPGKHAFVFGTGSVSIYSSNHFSSFNEHKPVADSVHAIQLLHGHSIDLQTLSVLSGPENAVVPEVQEESGSYHVLLSGSEGLSSNTGFLNHFVSGIGKESDTILVVTAAGRAKAFTSRLWALKARVVVLETSAASNDVSQIDLRNSIRDSRKVLFVENSDAALFNFLKNGATGELLEKHIRRNDIASGFIGENSRYAGKIWVSNHLGNALAAYQGKLVYREGLGLLQSTVVMSNTYDANDADFYENTTASVSYAMIHDGLKYGIYLNRDSFLEFFQKSGRNFFQAPGDLSTMVMVHEGSKAGFASQAVNTAGDVRNYVSFSSLQYILLNGEGTIDVGKTLSSSDAPYVYEMPIVGLERKIDRSSINIFPNPSGTGIFYLSGSMPNSFTLSVTDMFGRKMKPGVFDTMNDLYLDLSSYPDGIYLITWHSGREIVSIRGIKQGTEHR